MELLVWHDALGSDDEQATDQERAARLLYAHVASDAVRVSGVAEEAQHEPKEQQQARGMHALHFLEALVAFTRLLRRPQSTDSAQWVSAVLGKRRFYVHEVEPHVFFALGVNLADLDGTDLRAVHGAVLQQLYDVFRLLNGRVDRQLRALSPALATRFDDGMALLLHLGALRRRLRKITITQELDADRESDKAQSQLQDEAATLAREITMLDAASPSRVLWQRCDALFPRLLRTMEVHRMNMFHEVDGVAYFPMDETTFLSLQTLVNSFLGELAGIVRGGVALFYKGNVLWRTIDAVTLHTLQRLLCLREQDGMDVASGPRELSTDLDTPVWMRNNYDDAFSPVWASKTTYAECAVVRHIASQPRRLARSIHKQTPRSMGTLVADLMDAKDENAATAEQRQLRRGHRYRSDAPVYRNRGFLTATGYFLPSWELAKPASNDTAWAPTVYPLSDEKGDVAPSTALLYHENDLSIVVLTKQSDNVAAVLQHLERIEDCLEKVQFSAMAVTIWKQYLTMTGSQPSRDKSSSSSQAPYVYLNRVNLAFKVSDQVPRLLKTKDVDLYPRPASLWAHYLPAASLERLNDAHAALRRDTDTVELRVKTIHDGWLVSQHSRASDRELYALFDTKVASVADTQDAIEELVAAQFSNTFL